jgi:hypothetical protein
VDRIVLVALAPSWALPGERFGTARFSISPEFTQLGRFFPWQPKNGHFPMATSVLVSLLAQMHMHPATRAIESRLEKLRPGQIVAARGYLVERARTGWFRLEHLAQAHRHGQRRRRIVLGRSALGRLTRFAPGPTIEWVIGAGATGTTR